MVAASVLLATLLLQFSLAYNTEDPYNPYPENEPSYPDDFENDYEVRRRSNSNFVRFGRSGDKYDLDYEDFTRPTRSGKIEKNDHFIRFGRSKQDFLRFGRDQGRQVRSRGDSHLRFGRSVPENMFDKKSGSNFMRFGRNSNFLRFGRDEREAHLIQLLNELIEGLKNKEQKNV